MLAHTTRTPPPAPADEGLERFDRFAGRHAWRTRDEFLEEVTDPYLLVYDVQDPETESFKTVMLNAHQTKRPAPVQVLRVRKRAEHFSFMITIGRAANNDCVLPDWRVSKFHGYLKQVGTGWTYTDARSTNGTHVAGDRILPEERIELASGAELDLGGCRTQFLLPNELYERLAIVT